MPASKHSKKLQAAQLNADDRKGSSRSDATSPASKQTENSNKKPLLKRPVLMLETTPILTRNVLIPTSNEEVSALKVLASLNPFSHEKYKAARQRYEQLYVECTERDRKLDKSYSGLPGSAGEWRRFCRDCIHLMSLHAELFELPVRTQILDADNDTEMQNKETVVRESGVQDSRWCNGIGNTRKENVASSGSYQGLAMGCMLKWNPFVVVGEVELTYTRDKLTSFYKSNRQGAEAKFKKLLESCVQLDKEVSKASAKIPGDLPKLQSFLTKCSMLFVLRQLIWQLHNYDPCQPTTMETEDRSPLARKHNNRLLIRSPAVTCIVRDKLVWMLDASRMCLKEPKAGQVGWTPLQPNMVIANVQPHNRFVLAVYGLMHDCPYYLEVNGNVLIEEYDKLQRFCAEKQTAVQARLAELLRDLQAVSIEQIRDLISIGVVRASSKLEQLERDCIQYLILRQLFQGKPITLALNVSPQPELQLTSRIVRGLDKVESMIRKQPRLKSVSSETDKQDDWQVYQKYVSKVKTGLASLVDECSDSDTDAQQSGCCCITC